ncbi:MAG: hypothetical protein FJX76_29135 [Armatimonadetes bacterium]|nr:hypothetical protein [Armatimonadota bacterium]
MRDSLVVEFSYGGGFRLVDPYFFHHVAEPNELEIVPLGREFLFGWQVEGHAVSDPEPGWRLFEIKQIESLAVTRTHFSPRPDARNYLK